MNNEEKIKQLSLLRLHSFEDFKLAVSNLKDYNNEEVFAVSINGLLAILLDGVRLKGISLDDRREVRINRIVEKAYSIIMLLRIISKFLSKRTKMYELLHSVITYIDFVYDEKSIYCSGLDEEE